MMKKYFGLWPPILALIMALFAQFALEPPGRDAIIGILLYIISFGFLIWSYLTQKWTLPTPVVSNGHQNDYVFRWPQIAISFFFAVAAFITFSGNQFTQLNLTLWFISILLYISGLWPSKISWNFSLPQFSLNRQLVVILIVSIIVIFFRVYRINSVPIDPFSDQAEKILDIYDITQGETRIFFPRNTGRESFQMYLTLAVSKIFNTGLSFLSLKIGTILCGLLTLPFIYLLGKELGNRRVGLLAVIFSGIAYWPNVISRVGLRFTLYPFFLAPTLYYFLLGLRTRHYQNFILSGLFLGLGLHGYTPFRIVPLLLTVGIGIYLLHRQSIGHRLRALTWLTILSVSALLIFLPLLRYWIESPQSFSYRSFSRLGVVEFPLADSWWKILFSNIGKALLMFNWDNGNIWVNSIPNRPALDIVSGALLITGVLLLIIRYFRNHHWQDLFLLISIPILQLPSSLSLSFPAENPAPNRASGVMIPIFIIVALTLDGWLTGIQSVNSNSRRLTAWVLTFILILFSSLQNFDLVFRQYDQQFRANSWNSSEIGSVVKQFKQNYGSQSMAWIIPYPHWVDTRLPGIWAGIPNWDLALSPENLTQTQKINTPKLFIFKSNDFDSIKSLNKIYPQGQLSLFTSSTSGHDFWVYLVLDQ